MIPRLMRLLVLVFLGASGIASGEASGKKPCTEAEETQAGDEADRLKDWDAVYKSYQRFSQCDDGYIAEGYSDSVGRLLASHWEHFNRLATLAATDKVFQQFVLRHIDETLPEDVLKRISENARSYCPQGSFRLCERIAKESALSKQR